MRWHAHCRFLDHAAVSAFCYCLRSNCAVNWTLMSGVCDFVYVCICLCVCLCFKGKWLELSTPNLVHAFSGSRSAIGVHWPRDQKCKGQGHTVTKTIPVTWLLVNCAAAAADVGPHVVSLAYIACWLCCKPVNCETCYNMRLMYPVALAEVVAYWYLPQAVQCSVGLIDMCGVCVEQWFRRKRRLRRWMKRSRNRSVSTMRWAVYISIDLPVRAFAHPLLLITANVDSCWLISLCATVCFIIYSQALNVTPGV